MTATTPKPTSAPKFCEGIQYFGEPLPEFDKYGKESVVKDGVVNPNDEAAVYQTILYADALRYLTLQVTGSKASGHPGGFASQAEAYASLVMLGHKNIITEVGHHAPGFYSAMFLDRSLEDMGINTGFVRTPLWLHTGHSRTSRTIGTRAALRNVRSTTSP
jgi:phosphoketolase